MNTRREFLASMAAATAGSTARGTRTPGEWLKSRGASAAAAELITLGFGTTFGSAVSFLLHGLNSRGSPVSYRIGGGNDGVPRQFSTRVPVRYGAPVAPLSAPPGARVDHPLH